LEFQVMLAAVLGDAERVEFRPSSVYSKWSTVPARLPMNPTFDSSAFDRATDPVLRLLPPQQAQKLVEYQPERTLQSRVEQLAAKSNEGELTAEERAEYLGYVQANKFVAILQATARRRLAEGS
jgi:hypothetical protein